jgi:hypothetical protein
MKKPFLLKNKSIFLTYHDPKNLLTKDILLQNIQKIITKRENILKNYYLVTENDGKHYHILLILEDIVRTQNSEYFDFELQNQNFHGNYTNILKRNYSNILKRNYSNIDRKGVKKYLTKIEETLLYLLKEDKYPYIKGFDQNLLKDLYSIGKDMLEYNIAYQFEEFQPYFIEDSKPEIPNTFRNFKQLTIDLSQKDTKFEFPENNTICICNYQNKKKFLNSIVTNQTAIIGKDFHGKNIKNIIDSTYLNQNLSDIEKNIESFFLETEKSTKRSQITELLHSKCIYICYTKSEKEKKKYKEMSYEFQEKNPWLQLDLLELVDILQQKKIENPINIVNIVIDNSHNINITNVDRILSLKEENALLKKRIEYLEEQIAKKKRK